MLINQKIGSLNTYDSKGKAIDRLPLEWYECSKRILHKKTGGGRQVVLKFLRESQHLQQDDVLYADEQYLIVVEILACDAIVIKPSSMYEMAFACYEIGNKHLPLFYQDENLLIPHDLPTLRVMEASGLRPKVEKHRLTHQLRTTVTPHSTGTGESLFTKILKLTSPTNE